MTRPDRNGTKRMTDQKLNILLVDDEPFIRSIIQEMLECAGHHPVTAENGRQALSKLAETQGIDLIISDMEMPEMNGMALIRKLREDGVTLPIIILTGNDEIKVAVEAMKAGSNDYLLKDENIQDTLFMAIDRVMEKHRLAERNRQLMADLARKNRELERLSLLDGLTDIPNRRYFDRVLAQEWRRCMLAESPISLIMADIDYFKKYNDTYGHQDGDDCLRQVAKALHEALGEPGDFVARYGGEEFVAVMPDTELERALATAEAMRGRIMGLAVPHESSEVSDRITLSIGVSCAVPREDLDSPELIAVADKALYEAKREGRDRVRFRACPESVCREGEKA